MKKILAGLLVTVAMMGTAVAGSTYKFSVSAPEAKVSAKSSAKISVLPTDGFKINLEYPTKVTLNAPAGVSLEKTKLTAKDAAQLDKSGVVFDVAYTATERGKKTITGEMKFATCTETSCDPQTLPLSFEIDAK
ncbi:MAG: hypothetical protein HUU21_07400 [Polyangiaceae bacterium]|nr:hypothetical protein [Polyangiaceae bacterium]NUQ73364.1 hypothetical protein [Polyangiaceae bacterium]